MCCIPRQCARAYSYGSLPTHGSFPCNGQDAIFPLTDSSEQTPRNTECSEACAAINVNCPPFGPARRHCPHPVKNSYNCTTSTCTCTGYNRTILVPVLFSTPRRFDEYKAPGWSKCRTSKIEGGETMDCVLLEYYSGLTAQEGT